MDVLQPFVATAAAAAVCQLVLVVIFRTYFSAKLKYVCDLLDIIQQQQASKGK
jgi:hypothetical protein